MKKSRLALNSAVVFGVGLCLVPGVSPAQTVYLGAGGLGINPTGTPPNPNRSNGSGGQFGNNGDIISSVVITEGYEDIQASSTTVPADAVTAPAIFFQINVYSPSTGTATDITTSAQSGYYTDYDLGLETSSAPDPGLVTTPTTVSQPFGAPFGISTGMNYFIAGFNNKSGSPSTAGGNSVYNYSTTSAANGPEDTWNLVAGATGSPYSATSTVITTTSMTYGIPLSDLGLAVGNSFTFDAYDTFADGDSTYDDLDDPSFAPAGYYPYSNNPGGATPSPFDSATAGGTLAKYTVTVPTLTWNNTSAAAGFSDGVTWDTNDINNYNWNNGIFADYYVDGSNVVFNDENNATSNGGANPNAYNVTLNVAVAPASVVVNNSLGNYTISGAGSIGGTGSLTKSGTGTLTLATANTYSGGTTVTAGLLEIEPTSSTTSALPKGALSISGSGEVRLASNVTVGSQSGNTPITQPTSNVNLTSLSISGSGTLDITNNHIIVDYSSLATDPISSIVGWIKSGYAGGTWAGDGITSSTAAANSASYGIGYADAHDPGNPAGLSSGQIEIMYTLLGDANLDGKVNGADFTILAANFNQSGKSWDQGDFNYDGDVNGGDFTLLAKNFNQTAIQSAIGAADLTALDDFAASNGISLASVPEPASAALGIAIGLGALCRRRRKI